MLVLRAWNVGPGDAVFVPAFTFAASAEVVALVGATPVFVDVLEDTYNMDPASLEAAIAMVRREGKLTPRGSCRSICSGSRQIMPHSNRS